MDITNLSPILIQGITNINSHYLTTMQSYGTQIAAGVSIGNGGQTIEDIPVYDLVETAMAAEPKIITSIILVNPYEVLDAAIEAIAAGIRQIIIATTGVPPLDTIRLLQYAQTRKVTILGPGSDGILIPEQILIGTLQPQFFKAGAIGIISCSSYLSYEVAEALKAAKLGCSIVIDLGDEEIQNSDLLQWLTILQNEQNTKAVILIGRPKSDQIEPMKSLIESKEALPVVTYVAGVHTPAEIGDRAAETIVTNQLSASVSKPTTYKQVVSAWQKIGVEIAYRPSEVAKLIAKAIK